MTYRQEGRRYSCRWSIFLVAWSSEWNWYSGFRKKTPSLEKKITVWCSFSFPPVFLQGDPQCSLQFQSKRAKNRCPALAGCSTSHHTSMRVLGDCDEAPHDQIAALRGWHSCRGKKKKSCLWISKARMIFQVPFFLSAAPQRGWGPGGHPGWAQGYWGFVCVCTSLQPCLPWGWHCCLGSKLLGALSAAGPRLMSTRVYWL